MTAERMLDDWMRPDPDFRDDDLGPRISWLGCAAFVGLCAASGAVMAWFCWTVARRIGWLP